MEYKELISLSRDDLNMQIHYAEDDGWCKRGVTLHRPGHTHHHQLKNGMETDTPYNFYQQMTKDPIKVKVGKGLDRTTFNEAKKTFDAHAPRFELMFIDKEQVKKDIKKAREERKQGIEYSGGHLSVISYGLALEKIIGKLIGEEV